MSRSEGAPSGRRRLARAALAAAAAGAVLVSSACTDDPTQSSGRTGDSPTAAASATELTPLTPTVTDPHPYLNPVDAEVAAALEREFAQPGYEDLRAALVLVDGRTVFERYYRSRPGEYHHVWAVTTSVLGTLVGIAIAQGAIAGVDATMAELLPEYAAVMTPAVARTTLEQVLTMQGGFSAVEPSVDSEDWVADILSTPALDPGVQFLYSDPSSHLLAAILVEATGVPVLQYARTMLFDPLGIPTTPAEEPELAGLIPGPRLFESAPVFGWAVFPPGIHTGGYGLRLRARDLARIGLVHLAGGVWAGTRVIPSSWIRAATSKQVDAGSHGSYGYQWWTEPRGTDANAYRALGDGGQYLGVYPDRQLVVVFQAHVDPTSASVGPLPALLDLTIRRIILPAYPTSG